MSDFKFPIDELTRTADMEISNGDFSLGDDLITAATVSLFSDRRATDDELNTYAIGTPKPDLNRGLWLDTWRDRIQYGSGFWLLMREKKTVETLSRFESYGRECLSWMVSDGVAKSVNCTATYDGDVVNLTITITRERDEDLIATFTFAWDQLERKFSGSKDVEIPIVPPATLYVWLATNSSTSLAGVVTPSEGADATYIIETIENEDATGAPAGQYLGTAGPGSTPIVRFASGEEYTTAIADIPTPCVIEWYGKFTIPTADEMLVGDPTSGTGIGVGFYGRPYMTDGTTRVEALPREPVLASDDFSIDGLNTDRWLPQVGTWTVSGGSLRNSIASVVTNYIDNKIAAQDGRAIDVIKGDFDISGVLSSDDMPTSGNCQLSMSFLFQAGPSVSIGFYPPESNAWFVSAGGTTYYPDTSFVDVPWSISRVGSTVTAWIGSPSNFRTITESSDMTWLRLYCLAGSGGIVFTGEMKEISVEDGSGNGLYVPSPWDDDFHTVTVEFDGADSRISIDGGDEVIGNLPLSDFNDLQIMPGAAVGDVSSVTINEGS